MTDTSKPILPPLEREAGATCRTNGEILAPEKSTKARKENDSEFCDSVSFPDADIGDCNQREASRGFVSCSNTVETRIGIYCAGHHGRRDKSLCDECAALRDYVRSRLAKCPHGETKPSCSKCEIHCYREPERTTIRKVMAYAGPRMAIRHPIQTVKHLLASKTKK